jgi:putative acetyltransferase
MIREFRDDDLDVILNIWLQTSINAHSFVEPEFWEAQVDNMRTIYIPASETYVFENNSKVIGFYSLHENTLAAIFVCPEFQGRGFGKGLLSHAKRQRDVLTLNVYKENESSYQFYLSQGFSVISEQADQHTGHLEYTMSTGRIQGQPLNVKC